MTAAPATLFRYRALDGGGGIREGRLTAGSEHDALERLRRSGLRPLSIERHRVSALARELSVPGLGPRVKPAELAVVARQFATMVAAGIPLLRTLEVLQRQTRNPMLASTLDQLQLDVESGQSLSDAVAAHPRVFDRLFVSMIRAGEASGALDIVLGQLAVGLERSVAVRQKIRSAMTYPVAVLVMVLAVITAMLTFVVPTFAGVYEDLDGTLPLPTRVLVGMSALLTARLPLVAVTLIAAVIVVRRWKRTANGRYRWDAAKLRLPLIGPLLRKSVMARFGRTMSVLTRSGVPVLETLRISAETVGNEAVARALSATRDAVRRGEPIAANLAADPLFPPLVVQLVAVGEETGSLEKMFDIVGSSFEDEVETAVAGFAALIEPLLMAVIGVVVGAMVIALYLPMFRIIDLVQ